MFVRVPSQVYTVEGSTVKFECQPPDSFPPAIVTWNKDGETVSVLSKLLKMIEYISQ